ncbi:MAG: hypothetical protein LBK56_06975 [Gracilibacteraceae bacterium]|jgi:hypothetical protein|nr:hypothetical protein [Gracilibacteraceae bacterium]
MKKLNKTGGVQFILGVIIGAVFFGGAAAYAAAGVIAQPMAVAAVIDGRTASLKGYVIEGSHYFQLRDTSAALKASGKDFSAVWDDANSRVVIDTTRGYDGGEQAPQAVQPIAIPTPAPLTGGYGFAFSPLKTGDIVNVSPVATSKGSVGGDYKILRGPEDRPWKTADGTLWPNVPLPAWQSEWDSYPRLTFPGQPPVRFTGETYGFPYDTLMVFNPYEVERMARTIYKYARQNPLLWKNHDPSTNIPNFTISVEITDDMGPHTFYPWRDWEIEKFVKSTGGGTVIRIYAYDSYNNGKFLDTEYFMK